MTVFTAAFSAVAISAAQDLFEIVAPANSRIRLLEIDIGQYSDFADAQAEILSLAIYRGHTTTGSGGSAVTPKNVNPYSRASGATVAANNTTVATTAGDLLWATGWHLQAGFIWRQPEDFARDPFRRHILLKPSQRLVIRTTVPADAITTNGSILFEEIGKSPVS